MKVIIAISHSFCANFIRGQASFLKENGCEVLIVSAPGPEVSELCKNEKVRLIEIPFSREISLFNDIKHFFLILGLIRREKPSIINAGNPKTGFLFVLAGLFFPRIPKIFTLRGLRSDTLVGLKRRIVVFTEYISCNLADKVIVISPTLKDHAVKLGILKERKAVVLGKGSSNGIDINRFNLTDAIAMRGQLIKKSLGIKNTDLIIGHVGRITRDKGIEELYKAFKICQKTHRNIKLILTGPLEIDDPVSPAILLQIENDEDVILLGKRSDMPEIYSIYDIFVLYSYREGFGNVALEAAAMQLPVIVSDIPGAKDTIEDFKSGLLAVSGSGEKLAIAIDYYLSNPDIRKSHGTYGSMRVRKYFSSETIWIGQYNLYKELVYG